MANNSSLNGTFLNQTDTNDEELGTDLQVFWFIGIGISTLCLCLQIFLFIVVSGSRKLDQKILTQMTVARLLNVIFEYLTLHVVMRRRLQDVVFTLYLQTDAALICWMFVFTKNLYDKVVVVFTSKTRLLIVSVLIWVLTLPLGVLLPVMIRLDYFEAFYKTYGSIKFIILSVNLLFFCRIFWIAFRRRADRNLKRFVRTCVSAFLLVCITSLQVFLSDITSFFELPIYLNPRMGDIFSVINSYEAVAMTILFVILVEGTTESPITQQIVKRFNSNSNVII